MAPPSGPSSTVLHSRKEIAQAPNMYSSFTATRTKPKQNIPMLLTHI